MKKRKFTQIIFLLMVMMLSTNAAAELPQDKVSGTLYTEDKVAIAYDHYKKGRDSVIIVIPGFFNSKKNRWMRKTVDLVLSERDVIIFDLRGHGESGGRFTWGAKEHMDVNAAVNYAVAQGYKHIGIVAYSFAAAASVNAAALREDIDSMVLIGCPTSFWKIEYHFWESGMLSDLKDSIESKWEGKGARITHIFIPKQKPIKTIAKIKHTAILFIHGDRDWIIKDHHSMKLYNAAKTYKKLKIIEGGLHSGRLIQFHPGEMKESILNWFSETLNKDI